MSIGQLLSIGILIIVREEDGSGLEEASSSEEAQQSELEDESSSDDGEDPLPAIRPYAALMQSLSSDSGPQSKRLKLDHPSETAIAKQEASGWKEDDDAVAEDADEVEEPEEGPETATDGLLEDVEDYSEDLSDPFEVHFANPDDNLLGQRLESIQRNQWDILKAILPQVGKAVVGYPHAKETPSKFTINEVSSPEQLKLKQKLANVMSKQKPSFDILEKNIAPLMFNFQDMLYCEQKTTNSENLRRLACLHAVNHIYK